MGNVELFELFETDPKTQSKECLVYWSQDIVYSTCGHLLKESEANRGHSVYIGRSLNSKLCHKKREDFMAINMGKIKNKETVMLPIIWERDSWRGVLNGFTVLFWKILNFVNLDSNMIELKMSVSRWTILRRKFSPITWRKQSTSDTERIGGSLSIILEKLDQWDRSDFNDALTTLDCLHQESGENSGQCHSGKSKMATIVEFCLQLVAMEWSSKEFKGSLQMSSRAKRHDRTGRTRCLQVLGWNLRLSTFKIFLSYFVAVGSFTVDGGLLQPTEL